MRTVKTWLATIAVLLCSITASAYTFQVDGIYYKILSEIDKTVEITSTQSNKKYSGYIIIPESIEYGGIYRVVGIGEGAFRYCSDLYSVTIPKSVTNIGDEAFYECSKLTSVTIPNSVTNIGDKAFSVCSKLTSVTIPNSVTNIGEYAFSGCYDLTSVTIGNGIVSIGTNAFESCYNLKSVHIEDIAAWCKIEFESSHSNPLYEAKTLYLNRQEVTDLVIPNSVNSIGNYAFHGCESLTSVTFGDNVTSIGSDAFTYCSNLISVTIPRSVTTINTWAFTNCNKLEAVYIEDMEAWLNIDFGNLYANPLYYAGTLYLNGEKVTELEFPQSVTCIKGYTFPGFEALSTLVIPNHITSIGSYAFYACQALKSITIPSSVTEIGYDAFHLCNNQYNQLTVYIENITTWYNIDFKNSMSNPLSYAETLYLNKEKVTELVIPDGVVCIKDYAFYNYDGLTSVTIPNSVTSIGDNAFYDCDKLASVTIPNSVTNIGAEAFYSCNYLDNVEIPNSVATIGKYAFYDTGWYNLQTDGVIYAGKFLLGYKGTMPANTSIGIKEGTAFIVENAFSGCANLTSVEIPNSVISIGDYAFDGCSGLTSVVIPNSVTSIGQCAFKGCSNLTSVEIPNSVTSIGDEAFSRCSGLTSVVIPNSVTSIGDNAFAYSGLTSVEIPNSVTSIGSRAFYGCSNLTSVEIPNSVTSIEYEAFYGCANLTSVEIPNSVTNIGRRAFYDSGLTSILLGNGVTNIEEEAFDECTNLKTVVNCSNNISITKGSTNHGSIAYYAENVFNNCDGLNGDFVFGKINDVYYIKGYIGNETDLLLPANYKDSNYEIGPSAFSGCSNLTSVTIGNNVTNIGQYAFNGCSNLTSVEIPNSVISIGDYAFDSCSGLTSVTINATSIGSSAFSGCSNLTSVTIGDNVAHIGYNAFYETAWYNNQPDGVVYLGNCLLEYKGNMLANTSVKIKDGTTLIAMYAFLDRSELISVEIPNSVTSIGDNAFFGCSGLTSVVIPNSVTSIANYVFCVCSGLTSVEIPNSVTSIGDNAFLGCSGLTSVEIPNSVTSIGGSAFAYSGLTSVEIPNSVTSIGDYAFSYSGLTSVIIGKGVTSIDSGTFQGCSNLTSITSLSQTPPVLAYDVFSYNETLYVPYGSKSAYSEAQYWGNFAHIEELEPTTYDIIDGIEYTETSDKSLEVITYTRTLSKTNTWNALYVPFEIPMTAEFCQNYDVAYFNDIHSYDNNQDGVIDGMDMEVLKIQEGTVLNANHPYLIRAKNAGALNMNIKVEDAILYKAKETTLSCSSVYMRFDVTGIYTTQTAGELKGEFDVYAISGGSWKQALNASQQLKPFRLYLKLTSIDGSPVKVSQSALSRINIRLQGEDTETGIDELKGENGKVKTAVYDLSGRRVQKAQKGLYIVNGKKVIK